MSLLNKIDPKDNEIVFVYTICGNLDEARSMGFSIVTEKLAVSMDYWLINSIYPWQNVIQDISQYMIMFATQRKLSEKLIKHIESIHTYNIPMISLHNTPIVNKLYSLWLDNSLNEKDETKIIEKKSNIFIRNKLK